MLTRRSAIALAVAAVAAVAVDARAGSPRLTLRSRRALLPPLVIGARFTADGALAVPGVDDVGAVPHWHAAVRRRLAGARADGALWLSVLTAPAFDLRGHPEASSHGVTNASLLAALNDVVGEARAFDAALAVRGALADAPLVTAARVSADQRTHAMLPGVLAALGLDDLEVIA
jgi:hypothetical protein